MNGLGFTFIFRLFNGYVDLVTINNSLNDLSFMVTEHLKQMRYKKLTYTSEKEAL